MPPTLLDRLDARLDARIADQVSGARAERRHAERAYRRRFHQFAAVAAVVAAVVAVLAAHATAAQLTPDTTTGDLTGVTMGDPRPIPPPQPSGALVELHPAHGERIAWALSKWDGNGVDGHDPLTITANPGALPLWIAADYLTRHPAVTAWRLDEIRRMLAGDTDPTDDLYDTDGAGLVVARATAACDLADTSPYGTTPASIDTTAIDEARLVGCVMAGGAGIPGAGLAWLMRLTRDLPLPGHPIALAVPLWDVYTVSTTRTSSTGTVHAACAVNVARAYSLVVLDTHPAALHVDLDALCAAIIRQVVTT